MELNFFYIDQNSALTAICIVFLVSAAVFVILGAKGQWNDSRYVITQVVLMVLSVLLLIIYILFLNKQPLWISTIPILLALVSLMFKLFLNPRFQGAAHHVLTIVLYSVLLLIWTLTVTGVIRNKWILFGLISLPLIIHLFGEDLPIWLKKAAPISYVRWMQEAALLSMMLSLLFFILAMKSV